MVLLKNEDNILPLRTFRRILVAGDFINARAELFGTWTPDGRAEDVVPVREGLKDSAPKDVEFWFSDNVDQAMKYALQVDAVILLLGEHPRRSGENANLCDLALTPSQAEFMDRMVAIGKPIVLVVFAGRPLVITRQLSQADAVLYAWHPGIEGATALGEILFGTHAPSGRLPITFPRATGQVPIYYNHKNSGRPVTMDGQFTSRYIDLPNSPLFPFGYGLSYTSFEYSNLKVSQPSLHGQIVVSAEITNSGGQTGDELVQMYVRDLVGSLTRPVRELKGFQHIELQPGETRSASFTLDEEMLSFTRSDGTRGIEVGRFQVWIAPNSAAGLSGGFNI
jgi:beta-glucosidase